MSKKRKVIIGVVTTLGVLLLSVVSFGYWFISLLPEPLISKEQLKLTKPADLPYLTEDKIAKRGKILAVVTSTEVIGDTDMTTGYELTELSRAYYVFEANGFEVYVASPRGGQPPVVIDGDDMKIYDYAFLNDDEAQSKVKHSLAIADIDHDDYDAIYFVGGKGAMFDFPENRAIQNIVREYYESGKAIGAVCHGPSALVNVQLSNGQPLLADKKVSGFTNEEELFLIPEAEEIFPFLLQDKLSEQGAEFAAGNMYLNQVTRDGNIVTGQNPWSTWSTAESIIQQMGYKPKFRETSPEENSIEILETYLEEGFDQAQEKIKNLCNKDPRSLDRELLAVHSIVATMDFDLSKTVDLIHLLRYSNTYLK